MNIPGYCAAEKKLILEMDRCPLIVVNGECIREGCASYSPSVVLDAVFLDGDGMYDYYDEEETIENCTVQILRNSKTGKVSVGWWRN